MNATKPASGERFLGLYRPVRFLSEGGMGQVFLGRQIQTGQEVVIKVMLKHLANEPRLRAAFQREMQIMMRFRHPHAVALLDASLQETGEPCLILEYINGITLETLLQGTGRLSPARAGRLLGQLCQVLHAANSMGILHRDLSTENLMVMGANTGSAEKIKVMDFGLARFGNGFFLPLEKLNGTGNSIGGGTPDFMCPEQIRGEEVDQRGDLYSVGVILYKMLTGRLPMGELEEVSDILLAHVRNEPFRFAQVGVQDVPPALEALVMRCLAKYPNERPQSARELADLYSKALGHAIARPEDFISSEPVPPQEPVYGGLVLDSLQAWMPEPVAIMKLRGFVEGVGGQIVASEPGLIRVRLKDPRVKPVQEAPKGILGFLGIGRRTLVEPASLLLELYMEKKQSAGRSLVEITAVLPQDPLASKKETSEETEMRRGFGERICRELRAYLMIGR